MVRCRGSAEFLELSVQLFGPVSPALLGEAEALLANCSWRYFRRALNREIDDECERAFA